MHAHRALLLGSSLFLAGWVHPVSAVQDAEAAVSCRERPCAILVDWTREGGIESQVPDRRYGQAAQLEDRIRSRLVELGFSNFGSRDADILRIVLVPHVGNAMCDEVSGTATDMSCRAILDLQARVEGPDAVRKAVDIPSRIRNRCSADKVMVVDRFAAHIVDWIVYALEGKSKGERRPVARC
jgi:hypothetical protein